jgi:adenylate cyclase
MRFDDDSWLEGLQGPEREQRRKLLELLDAEGFSEDEVRVAIAENRLALLPVDRVLGGTYTAREIEQRSGLPAAVMTRIRRLVGLVEPGPDDRVFSAADIEAARSIKQFLDAGFSEDSIVEISSVLGEGMSRLAATITVAALRTFLRKGDTEEDAALRFMQLAERLTPAIGPILESGFNAHLRDTVRRGMLGRQELARGEPAAEQQLCVCFADLVGFTRMGGAAAVGEVGSVAGRLALLAADTVQPPVRLIKTIGDAAMFVSPEAEPIVQIALALVDAVAAEDLPSLRAGIGFGPVMLRAGDYFGNTVNVASRVTGAARPGSVLCTAEIHDACPNAFHWSFAGRHRLKGVATAVPLYRARAKGSSGN